MSRAQRGLVSIGEAAGAPGRFLRQLGPGLITGASDDDPSGIGTYSVAGAAYGFSTLWLNGAIAPVLLVVIMLIANDRDIMKSHANGLASNVVGWATTGVMSAAAVAMFLTLGR